MAKRPRSPRTNSIRRKRLRHEAAAVVPDVTAPTITSPATAGVAENSTLSHALTANESVTWSITGGDDQARFEISGSTLRWALNGTKNYEAPNDANTDNAYVVQVTATDGASNAASQTVTVTVTNVIEFVTFDSAVATFDGTAHTFDEAP